MSRPTIILPTQYYDPEPFQVNELAKLFILSGWRVIVITPTPSYPRRQSLRGSSTSFSHPQLHIYRLPIFPRNGNSISALINSASFALLGSIVSLIIALSIPQAQIFVVQYSPITCIIPGLSCSLLLRRQASIWIFDLWPHSLQSFFGNNPVSNIAQSLISSIVPILYKCFSVCYVSSPSFLAEKVIQGFQSPQFLHSWESSSIPPRLDPLAPSASLHIVSIGHLGSAHDLELIERLILELPEKFFRWTFVGSGSGNHRITNFVAKHGLNNVSNLGFLPKTDCLNLCRLADLSLVPFRDTHVSNTLCYRFVSSLSVATPIVCLGSNSLSSLVLSSGCGYVLAPPPSQPTSDANCVHQISDLESTLLSNISHIRTTLRVSAAAHYQACFSQRKAHSILSKTFNLGPI